MGRKDDTRERDRRSDSFESTYAIKGDGIAVLRPDRLRADPQFSEKIRKFRELNITKK